jgi:two-component system chemotaxis response regulator CheB
MVQLNQLKIMKSEKIISDKKKRLTDKFTVIVLGASFGGRKALDSIFLQLSEDLGIAVVVAQHIANGFMPELVSSFAKKNILPIGIANNGDRLKAGKILFAPSEFNMEIKFGDIVKLSEVGPGGKSSIDVLFSSVARVYKNNCIGIILTGMGDDGVEGIKDIKNAGGYTIAEAKEDCDIFGMPRLAIERGYIDKVVRLEAMGKTIREILEIKRKK